MPHQLSIIINNNNDVHINEWTYITSTYITLIPPSFWSVHASLIHNAILSMWNEVTKLLWWLWTHGLLSRGHLSVVLALFPIPLQLWCSYAQHHPWISVHYNEVGTLPLIAGQHLSCHSTTWVHLHGCFSVDNQFIVNWTMLAGLVLSIMVYGLLLRSTCLLVCSN